MMVPELGFYYHYKHDPAGPFNMYAYEVVGLARHSEDKSYLVLYRPLYDQTFLAPAGVVARPLDMFMEMVEKNGESLPRFRKVEDSELTQQLEAERNRRYS